jgi:hypothetical protein
LNSVLQVLGHFAEPVLVLLANWIELELGEADEGAPAELLTGTLGSRFLAM